MGLISIFGNLIYLIICVIISSVIKYFKSLLEWLVLYPLGRHMGFEDYIPNEDIDKNILKRLLSVNYRHDFTQMKRISKKLNWSEDKIIKWLMRYEKNLQKSVLYKFSECVWHIIFRGSMILYGLYITYNNSSAWLDNEIWDENINPKIDKSIWWICTIQLGNDMSIIRNLSTDKRKDYWLVFIHHVMSILFFLVARMLNLSEFAVLFTSFYDISDIPLQIAKVFNYTGQSKQAAGAFLIFAFTFVSVKLVLLPFWVGPWMLFNDFKSGFVYVLLTILVSMFVLNVSQLPSIGRTIKGKFRPKLLNDPRSDDESEITDTDTTEDTDEETAENQVEHVMGNNIHGTNN